MSNADLPLTVDPLPISFTANKQTAIKGILLNILLAIRQNHTTMIGHELTIFLQVLHCSHTKNIQETMLLFAFAVSTEKFEIRLAFEMWLQLFK